MDQQRQNAHEQFQSDSRCVQGVAFPPFVCRLGHEKRSYRRPECGMENEGVTIHAEDTVTRDFNQESSEDTFVVRDAIVDSKAPPVERRIHQQRGD